MPNMYTQILAVGLVAFLVLRANGAPLTEATTVLPSSDTSSEEETAPLLLLTLVRQMKKPEEVTGLSSNKEESLLRSLYHPDAFHRKMTAHNILRKLYIFIVDGERALRRKERRRGKHAKVFAMFSLLR
ncbi:interleukin-6-like [Syngnathus typhle]|uniref:interleukin-6-like n=1 Tax=Syngnathus typhle TaxID=161592 RepID=UPI002A69CB95|nr:interleukin-6-like [Syngnathus typhle]